MREIFAVQGSTDLDKEWASANQKAQDILSGRKGESRRALYVFCSAGGKLSVSGSNTYADVWFEKSGLVNVAAGVKGNAEVSMEQVYEWNPDLVFVFIGSPAAMFLANQIKGQDWWLTTAHQNGAIYDISRAVYSWGPPCSDSPLMPLWLIHKSYPQLLSEDDFSATWKLAGVAGLLLVMVLALFVGRYSMDAGEVGRVLLSPLSGRASPSLDMAEYVIWQVRLPRILLTALVGAGLAVVGASLQGLFQNPLVSPDILGVCSGAGFGAALGILLTSGIGLVFTALTSLIKYVADTNDQLPAITFLMGSFANTVFADLRVVWLPILLGITGLLLLRWRINILSLGDEEALSLGINPRTTRIVVIVLTTIITAASVMVSGIVGWVGLVIPHLVRRFVGVNHKSLLPASCLLGAGFLVVVDCAARNLTAAEIPIGILTALLGAPFFALIYGRLRGEA